MLMLMLPLVGSLLLPLLNVNWSFSVYYLMMCSLAALLNMPDESSLNMISNWLHVDSMSVLLAAMSSWISALMILASNKVFIKKDNDSMFMLLVLILNLILNLCFMSSKIIMFYIFFEASLIPTMLLMLMWGNYPERVQSIYYLMIYTVTASLPMLILILYITDYTSAEHFSMMWFNSPNMINPILWIVLMLGFLVKLPVYSLHLWLPKAHVFGPVAVSMALAGIMMKMGCYGLMRMTSLAPWLNEEISPLITSLALTGSVISSIICLRQVDMKALIAYSSVSHMGLFLAGLMSSTKWGVDGALMMMIAHSLTSSALFVMANINYDITHSRSVILSKGMLTFTPFLSMLWFMFLIINMGAPPSINLMSEIMLITAVSSKYFSSMILLALTTFITAAYCLNFYSAVNHGPPSAYMNLQLPLPHSNITVLLYHMVPMLMLIMKPEIITI